MEYSSGEERALSRSHQDSLSEPPLTDSRPSTIDQPVNIKDADNTSSKREEEEEAQEVRRTSRPRSVRVPFKPESLSVKSRLKGGRKQPKLSSK
jgi:hypothetical protein